MLLMYSCMLMIVDPWCMQATYELSSWGGLLAYWSLVKAMCVYMQLMCGWFMLWHGWPVYTRRKYHCAATVQDAAKNNQGLVYQCVYAEMSIFSWDVHLCRFHATCTLDSMKPFTGSEAHDYLHQHSKDGPYCKSTGRVLTQHILASFNVLYK